jgi:hypothetical protein
LNAAHATRFRCYFESSAPAGFRLAGKNGCTVTGQAEISGFKPGSENATVAIRRLALKSFSPQFIRPCRI